MIMTGKLGSLLRAIVAIALRQNISVEEMKSFISLSYPKLRQAVAAANSMQEVFEGIRSECSITNDAILTAIADEFFLNDAFTALEVYHSEVKLYRERLLNTEFAKELNEEAIYKSGLPGPKEIIYLKLKWIEDKECATLKDFQDVVCSVFESLSRYIHLLTAREGCVVFVCYAPVQVMAAITRMVEDGKEDLIRRGVLLLVVGGRSIILQVCKCSLVLF